MNLNDLKNFFGLHEKSFVPNVGLGTSVPGSKLDVVGAITSRPHGTAAGETGKILMHELAANGTDAVTIRARDSFSSYTLTLPTDDGGSGEVLTTDGNGNLTWAAGGGGAATSVSASAGNAGAPSISFSGDPNTGFYSAAGDQIGVAVNGVSIFTLSSSGLVAATTGGGSVSTANGTASTPTFSFTGDPDTGWFRPAANTLAAATGGSERVRIDSNGNFGIGSTSPPSDVRLYVEAPALGGTAGNETVLQRIFQTAGNLNKFEMKQLRHTTGADWAGTSMRLQRTVDTTAQGFIDFGVNATGSNSGLGFGTGTATNMVMTDTGRIGIGTTLPLATLHIAGDTLNSHANGAVSMYPTDGAMEIVRYAGSAYLDLKSDGLEDYDVRFQSDGTTGILAIYTGGGLSPSMYINAVGNTGLGVDPVVAPARLAIQGATTTTSTYGGTSTPQTQNYTSSTTWQAPAGVTSVTVEVWGGGGGGGGAGTTNGNAGGGGAGGSYAKKVVTVTPGQTYTVTVGTGGAGGASGPNNGTAGNPSWFDAVGTVYAQGGARGNAGASGTGGAGSAASSIGDTVYAGGSGANGSSGNRSGGGGGGAGSAGAGGSTTNADAGLGNTEGGDGGVGIVSNNTNGNPGLTYGGGGSGGYRLSSNRAGGAGANGLVKLAWTEFTAIKSPLIVARDSAGGNQFVVNGLGNVGIGVTAPTEKLHVDGNVLATAYLYTSDARLKTDIVDVAGLELILKMRGVHFRWQKNGQPELGLIAQEVEAVAPDLVVTDPVSGMKSVKYGNLVAPLIQATKELYEKYSAMDDELQILKRDIATERQMKDQKIFELEKKNSDLEMRLQRLEKLLGSQK